MRGEWSDADAGVSSTSSVAAATPSSSSQPPQLAPRLPSRRDRLLGLACVLTVATVWAGASFVVAGVEAAGLPPLVLTYIANSLFVLYLPAYAVLKRARKRRERRRGGGEGRKEEVGGDRRGVPAGQLRQLDDSNFGGLYSGLKDVEREDGEEDSSLPLVPRPREGPRLGVDGVAVGGVDAVPSSCPLPAAPPPTPLDENEISASSPSSVPLLSPQNSRLLSLLDSCLLSRLFLPPSRGDSAARAATAEGQRTRSRCCLFPLASLLRPTAEERSVVLAAVVVAPLWFGAQLSFNASLTRTSVTSNTILSTASSLFTYPLAVAVLREPATAKKALSVAACVAGVVAVALADSSAPASRGGGGGGSPPPSPSPPSSSSSNKGTLAGDALVILSCTLYAGYTVAVRALLVDEDGGAATMLFFGCVGLINFVAGLPFVVLALAVPTILSPAQRAAVLSPRLFAAAAAKGLLDNVLSDYLWARAVLLIGPTVATVGLNVQVPLAAGLDAVWGRPKPRWTTSAPAAVLTAVGAAAVVGGVCGIAAGG